MLGFVQTLEAWLALICLILKMRFLVIYKLRVFSSHRVLNAIGTFSNGCSVEAYPRHFTSWPFTAAGDRQLVSDMNVQLNSVE